MGSIGKAIAVYVTPFWRADGLDGQVVSDTGIARSTFDNSPPDASYGALMGFIEADEMRAFDASSVDEVKAAVLKDYATYFGDKAKSPTSFVLQRWDNEGFSRGGRSPTPHPASSPSTARPCADPPAASTGPAPRPPLTGTATRTAPSAPASGWRRRSWRRCDGPLASVRRSRRPCGGYHQGARHRSLPAQRFLTWHQFSNLTLRQL